jgi:DNA-binding transcriptional ArsR family regulator
MSLPNISKHLKVLENAGLISRSRDAQRRPCKIEPEPLREVSAWVEAYRKLWEERFDRLDDYLRQLQDNEEKKRG